VNVQVAEGVVVGETTNERKQDPPRPALSHISQALEITPDFICFMNNALSRRT